MPAKARYRLILLLCLWIFTNAQMRPDDKIQITNVLDGRCFTDMQNRVFCLKGVWAPPMVSPDHQGEPAPHGLISRDALWFQLKGQSVYIKHAGAPDRWDRQPVYVLMARGFAPLQEKLLQQGLVRIDPLDLPNEKYTARFRTAQNIARAEEAGLWALSPYVVLTAATADEGLYQTRTIRAKILEVSERRDRTYLNTGADYRTDFTITLSRRLATKLKKRGIDLQDFRDKTVEATGLVTMRNGPSMALEDERQLIVLEGAD